MQELKPPSSIVLTVAGIFVAIITIIAVLIFSKPINPDLIQENPLPDVVTASCGNLTGESMQNCCNEWFESSGLMRIQCIGEWAWLENQCSWQCTLDDSFE